jgi:hypothetical protein
MKFKSWISGLMVNGFSWEWVYYKSQFGCLLIVPSVHVSQTTMGLCRVSQKEDIHQMQPLNFELPSFQNWKKNYLFFINYPVCGIPL